MGIDARSFLWFGTRPVSRLFPSYADQEALERQLEPHGLVLVGVHYPEADSLYAIAIKACYHRNSWDDDFKKLSLTLPTPEQLQALADHAGLLVPEAPEFGWYQASTLSL